MKHRTIIFPVILHPPSQDGIEHPRQVFQGFVAPQLEFPASDFLSDGLCSFVAYSRQEAHEVFPPVVSSPPGSELIAQEGKLLVLMRSSPIRILAINDFGFLEVKLQSAFSHPQDDRLALVFGFLLRSAMHDGIIGIPLKGDAWVLARYPRIEAVVQEKVCQQGRGYSSLRRSLFSRRQLSLLVLGRSFKPPFHIEHHPFLWGMLAKKPLISRSSTQSYFQHRFLACPTASCADLNGRYP